MVARIDDTSHVELAAVEGRRSWLSTIRWSAIFGGLFAGTASYLLLSLLGVAVGLTAIDPTAEEPLGVVPVGTGIWTGISLLVAAFVGGYVAARMSGLTRLMDGLLHGFVAWATITVFFTWLTFTAVGSVMGGVFSMVSQGVGGIAQMATGGQAALQPQLERIITGDGQGQINAQDLNQLQTLMANGNWQGAQNYMVNQMGFTEQRAQTVVNQAQGLLGQGGGVQAQEAAEAAVSGLTAASWWLFIGLLLSLVAGVWGGALGSRNASHRVTPEYVDQHRRQYEDLLR